MNSTRLSILLIWSVLAFTGCDSNDLNDPIAIPGYFVVAGVLIAIVIVPFLKQSSKAKSGLSIAGIFVGGGMLVFAFIVQELHSGFGGTGIAPAAIAIGGLGGLILLPALTYLTRKRPNDPDK